MNSSLTDRQRQVLDYLRQQIESTGLPPTILELQVAFGWSSPNAVRKHLEALAAAGAIEKDAHKARTIRLVGARKKADTLDLPLLGRVAAGSPIGADAGLVDTLAVDMRLFYSAPDYLLRVQGDSMIQDGILDGDLVGVKRTPEAQDGQVVVARLDGELTIKRLSRTARSLRLLPRNPAYAPIVVEPGQDFAVEGVFCGLVRRG